MARIDKCLCQGDLKNETRSSYRMYKSHMLNGHDLRIILMTVILLVSTTVYAQIDDEPLIIDITLYNSNLIVVGPISSKSAITCTGNRLSVQIGEWKIVSKLLNIDFKSGQFRVSMKPIEASNNALLIECLNGAYSIQAGKNLKMIWHLN